MQAEMFSLRCMLHPGDGVCSTLFRSLDQQLYCDELSTACADGVCMGKDSNCLLAYFLVDTQQAMHYMYMAARSELCTAFRICLQAVASVSGSMSMSPKLQAPASTQRPAHQSAPPPHHRICPSK